MNKRNSLMLLVMIGLCVSLSWAQSPEDYWPMWRGPLENGVAPKGDPPSTWSETKNIKWKISLEGNTNSTPVIWAEKLIYLTAIDTGQQVASLQQASFTPQFGGRERGRGGRGRGGFGGSRAPTTIYKFDVVCLNRNTGNIIWQKTTTQTKPHEGHHRDHGYASYSPVTDGKHIWASFGSRGLFCFDMNGNKIWDAELTKMSTRAGFGEGSSANIIGDAVVVVCDHEQQSMIYAFNKHTGDLLWSKPRDEPTSWATPIGIKINGKYQVITNATNRIRSYNLTDGDIVWQCGGMTTNVIPTPVLGHGMVYCTSGFRGSALLAIQLGRTGDLTGTDAIQWQISRDTPYVPSPLLYDDKLYFCSGNQGRISCFNARTGKTLYQGQNLDLIRGVYASPAGAAGRIYLSGRNGVTYVFKNSERYEQLAVNTLDDGIDASPVIVGKNLYLKGKKSLYCIAE